MTDDKPKEAIRGYVSEYLRQPLRSTREAQQRQREAAQSDSEVGKESQRHEG